MYPPSVYAEKIAQAVIDIFGSKGSQSVEIAFNDVDLLIKEQALSEELDETENTVDDIDKLIDDDPKEKTTKKKKKATSKIKTDKQVNAIKKNFWLDLFADFT